MRNKAKYLMPIIAFPVGAAFGGALGALHRYATVACAQGSWLLTNAISYGCSVTGTPCDYPLPISNCSDARQENLIQAVKNYAEQVAWTRQDYIVASTVAAAASLFCTFVAYKVAKFATDTIESDVIPDEETALNTGSFSPRLFKAAAPATAKQTNVTNNSELQIYEREVHSLTW